MIDNH